MPEGIALSDKNRILMEFLDFWVLTRERAVLAEASLADADSLIASLNVRVSEKETDAFINDLLRFRGGEVVVRLTGFFESMADRGMLSLKDPAVIRFSQFLPSIDPETRKREQNSRDALNLPPGAMNQLLQEPGDDQTLSDADFQASAEAGQDVGDSLAAQGELDDSQAARGGSRTLRSSLSMQEGNLEARQDRLVPFGGNESRPNQLLDMNSRNVIASLLSYRSEKGELPADLESLASAGHILLSLRDPMTNGVWTPTNSLQPGGLVYVRANASIGKVTVRPPLGAIRNLTVETAPIREGVSATGLLGEGQFSPEEQHTRRAVFQIAKLLELFYNQYGYLPSSVAQLELLGFAHVGFPNLLQGRIATGINSPLERSAGDYFYFKSATNEFLLIGYGLEGKRIITVRQPLAQIVPMIRQH